MTDEELRTLVASLAVSTTGNAEAIRELRETLRENTESQARNAESQARSIEALREGMSYNTEIMTNALELPSLRRQQPRLYSYPPTRLET
jgi:hypothetical protein